MRTEPKRINCQIAQEYSQLLLDGRLTSIERAELDCHLVECKTCTDMHESLRADSGLLASWTSSLPGPKPGDAFNARILAAIAQEPPAPSTRPISLWAVAIALSLASACCVAAGLYDRSLLSGGSYHDLETSLSGLIGTLPQTTADWTPGRFDLPMTMPYWLTIAGVISVAANIVFAAQARLKSTDGKRA